VARNEAVDKGSFKCYRPLETVTKLELFKKRFSSVCATELMEKFSSNGWIDAAQRHPAGSRIH